MKKNSKESVPESNRQVTPGGGGQGSQTSVPASPASEPVRLEPKSADPGKDYGEDSHGPACPSVYGDDSSDTFSRSRMPRAADWSVPWSDLMMTMFIFFVVLYVYQSAHREFELRGGEGLGSEMGSSMGTGRLGTGVLGEGGSSFGQDADDGSGGSINRIYDLSKQIMEKDFADVSGIELVPDKAVRLILTGDLLFDLGKADIKPQAKKLLDKVAGLLRETSYPVSVIGYTDSTPIHSDRFPTNWELSAVRACVVARYLIEEMKLPDKRFTVVGHAYNRPVRPNNTAKNKAANRRVEIVIRRDGGPPQPAAVFPNNERRSP